MMHIIYCFAVAFIFILEEVTFFVFMTKLNIVILHGWCNEIGEILNRSFLSVVLFSLKLHLLFSEFCCRRSSSHSSGAVHCNFERFQEIHISCSGTTSGKYLVIVNKMKPQ